MFGKKNGPRKKSRIERFFSLNQHRKRWGAARHAVADLDYQGLKQQMVEGDTALQTRGSEKSLDLHLENLRREFAGQPELLWHHARLIVLLRREFQVEQTFAQLQALWEAEAAFLCENLNLRWLVSAADSFVDHHPDAGERARAMLVSLLVNTVKIYETERVLATGPAPADAQKLERLQSELIPLFSGLSCFTIGTDDTLRNMRWRLDGLMAKGPVGLMLKTVFDRLQVEDTAFARLKAQHHRGRTGWWSE
ncbi:hypothetical protein FS764_07610 [Agrobacterium vitis]|uniref:hypothetical protein n=1 Tax=Agrobacterium vitis TaxID=373 RepID=UPI0008727E4D|nr:hypothetical protein [Agrobacterium vitis]MCE6073882.1 hypothetical protein [Agrobacterium vitis]MCF1466781.1 hypothetical protein [Agrobacterium vitis]MCM2468713.1 hypothetical protein [Agrobacterium vitis]MUO71571.1 hypothetical protein [Agrobacterium vitis]MUO86038.1 hypothetical protein [Agrobacterium vitis]